MPKALYPGSFDPLHNGHIDVIEQACRLFGEVVVVAMVNPDKTGEFTMDERRSMIEESVAHLPGASVEMRYGLAVDAAIELHADFIVKGLRTRGDFEVEMQMAHTNQAVAGVATVFVPCAASLGFLSSRYIRDFARFGGDVSALVPEPVGRRLKERYAR